jgi:hypothetical protein
LFFSLWNEEIGEEDGPNEERRGVVVGRMREGSIPYFLKVV